MIWPRKFTRIALIFFFSVLFVHFALYPQYGMPWGLLLFGIIVIVIFFNAMTFFTRRWRSVPDKKFVKSLFISSFFIKVIFLIITLLMIMVVDPESYPFEIGGGDDSRYYDRAGSVIADGMFKTDLEKMLRNFYRDKADYGYPTYVGFVYFIFGKETLILRLFSILFSCFTVIMIYRLARNSFNEEVGRLAGIMAMLIPVMLWFDTMAVKESVMTFLIVFCLYLESEIVKARKISVFKILFLVLSIYLLFYFRLFLVGLLSMVTAIYFLLNLSSRRISKVAVLGAFLLTTIVLSVVITESGSLDEFKVLMVQSQTQLEGELESAALGRGVSYQKTLVIPFLLAGAIVTPFPSLLFFDSGQLTMVSHFFNELVRNCLYFFGFLGLWFSYKKYFKESSLIVLYTFGYIFVLAVAGKSFQDRFQFPAFPGMLILIAVGLVHGKKYFNKWPVYLFFMGLAILMWNLFKLSIRGLL